MSIIPVSPYICVLEVNSETSQCEENWSALNLRSTYTATLFILQYLLPLTVIAGAYLSIGRELRQHSVKATSNCPGQVSTGNRYLKELHAEETKKVLRMLKVVTAVFAVSVLPTNIVWLWLDFGSPEHTLGHKHFWELVAFCNIITFANSAANPICYSVLNENYRKEIKKYVKLCFRGKFTSSKPSFIRNDKIPATVRQNCLIFERL